MPSSAALAEFMCSHIPITPSVRVVEIGAGTGRLTQALLKNGLSPQNLCIIELDPAMYNFLCQNFPHVTIIQGNACHLSQLLPESWFGAVDCIVSGIPMVNLSFENQSQIIQACLGTLSPQGKILQFTYGPLSPLPSRKLGLSQKRLGHVLMNFPPATVWQYTKAVSPSGGRKISRIKDLKQQSLKQFQRLKKHPFNNNF